MDLRRVIVVTVMSGRNVCFYRIVSKELGCCYFELLHFNLYIHESCPIFSFSVTSSL